jgi:hypothetical protein
MDKKMYYVNVEHGVILEDKGADSYEFEIYADDNEIHELQELFDKAHQVDMGIGMWLRAHTPYIQYHDDEDNHEYDHRLLNIYRKLHELGTDTTRKHIESMGVLHLHDNLAAPNPLANKSD